MYRKHHTYVWDQIFRALAVVCLSSRDIVFRALKSKPSVRLVSTRMKLNCRMKKRTKSEQETRTRKII